MRQTESNVTLIQDDDKATYYVPDSLLALAKDSRYVSHCRSLVEEILSVSSDLPDDTHKRWAKISSLFLYTTLVLVRRGRTLGMEACGLQIKSPSNRGKWRLVAAGWAVALVYYWYGERKSHQQNQGGNDSGNTSSLERLRGSHRRQYFEAQRIAMQQRATGTVPDLPQHEHSVSPNGGEVCASPEEREPMVTRLKEWCLTSMDRLLESCLVYSTGGGPHSVQSNWQQLMRSNTSLDSGLLRLYLGYYCHKGSFPTWLHGVFRLSYESKADVSNALVHRPSKRSVQVIGCLLLAQVLSQGLRSLSHVILKWISSQHMESRRNPSNASSIGFRSARPSSVLSRAFPESRSTGSCAICHQPRSHPACPINCGHIFCWHCLQHWVASVRSACPVCRTECRPRDILLLHN